MASAKQIAWRKKFAKMAKAGKFRKTLLKKQQKKIEPARKLARKKGYLPKIKGYQVCTKCLKKRVGSRDAWFQDFTDQKRICNRCIDEMRKKG
jgi:predicted nucleotidyltransferase